MMAVCIAFGAYVWTATGGTAGNFVAGRVVTFLSAICLCLSIVTILESGTSSGG